MASETDGKLIFWVCGGPESTDGNLTVLSGRSYQGDIPVGAVFRRVLSVEGETGGYRLVSGTELRVVEVRLFGRTSPTAFESYGVLLTVDGEFPALDWSSGHLCLGD